MFRWCAYCQHFMGESKPLENYLVTHGICAPCEKKVLEENYERAPSPLLAQRIFQSLFQSKSPTKFSLTDKFIQEALDANIKPSDLIIGILQPALYEVGTRWEKGLISPAEEQEFSRWSMGILKWFERTPSESEHGEIVLTHISGNEHSLGVLFLDVYLRDHGIGSRVIIPALSDQGLVEHCVNNSPRFCGISVSLPEGITRAKILATQIKLATHDKTKPFLGGRAFKEVLPQDSDFAVFPILEDLVAFLGAPA